MSIDIVEAEECSEMEIRGRSLTCVLAFYGALPG
jgi:hypothetical protein